MEHMRAFTCLWSHHNDCIGLDSPLKSMQVSHAGLDYGNRIGPCKLIDVIWFILGVGYC
jgi:hypothetical protein